MAFYRRDLTDIHCFTTDEFVYMLDQAADMKQAIARKEIASYRLAAQRDMIVALLFYENSTRTRTSFEIAAMRLGMRTTGFAGTEGTSVKKGESLRHTLDMYEAYACDALIMRHPLDGSARFAADHLGIPVFNAGDGKHEHPTQTILDLFTIREHLGRLGDFDMGIAGDLKYGRTAHSLVIALSKFQGVRLHLFSHKDLALPDSLLDFLRKANVPVTVHESLDEMATQVDILYSTRIQKERMPDLSEFERAKSMSEFTHKMLDSTRPCFGLMHPLPIDKTAPSISPSIDGHPKAIYKIQAGNGVPTRLTELALSLGLLEDGFTGEVYEPEHQNEQFIEELEVVVKPQRIDVSIRPIRDCGVVIDHIQPYQEEILVRLLQVRERRDIYRAGTVKSVARPSEIKGILMIENRELSDQEIRAIAAVSPGCRINFIEGGHAARKLAVSLPARITGIPQIFCPNKGCITRVEHQEYVAPIMVRAGHDLLRCYYCDQLVASAHML
ncbi:MAG: aspartate carbamoyltransferase [Myxococcota bacterium]|jgi:aspartate carbamoyltransferase catalytic subunit|nr:aspartate carbamoyltransferase [Myxococcota bacterium]